MDTTKKEIREPLFDIAKGLCMIFVVAGHCYAPYYKFYTLFHVLFFFILAGNFFKEEYIDTFNNLKNYIVKIWKRYALPYISCNVAFLCLYNFFIKMDIVTTDTRLEAIHCLNVNELITRALNHLFLISSSEQLCGATWFLKSLFWGLLTFALMRFIIKKTNKYIIYVSIIIFLLLLTEKFENNNLFYYSQSIILLCIGDILKNYIPSFKLKLTLILIPLLIILIYLSQMISIRMLRIIIIGILGFYFVMFLSNIIKKCNINLQKIFVYIGQHTIPILCFHLLVFKLVTYFVIITNNLSIEKLGVFPAIQASCKLSLLYLFVGIIFPISINIVYNSISRLGEINNG